MDNFIVLSHSIFVVSRAMKVEKVSTNYGTHSYEYDYEKTELYCPHCGKQEVWEEAGGGDYYLGVDYLCTACSHISHLDSGGETDHPEVVEQILTGKVNPPVPKRPRTVAESILDSMAADIENKLYKEITEPSVFLGLMDVVDNDVIQTVKVPMRKEDKSGTE